MYLFGESTQFVLAERARVYWGESLNTSQARAMMRFFRDCGFWLLVLNGLAVRGRGQ